MRFDHLLLFAFLAGLTILPDQPSFGADDPIPYDRPRQVSKLTNPAIKESSGLAWSNTNKDILWTHNDHGDQPRIFAFSLNGTHVAEYKIDGKAIDWEDMCSYETDRDKKLVIGDVGDNDVKRKKYAIYIFKEPVFKKKQTFGKITTLRASRHEFTYEDGSHNCEAIGVDSANEILYLVEKKNTNSCNIYSFELPTRRDKGPFVAKKVATIGIPTVTAMDISPDNRRAVLLTYGDAYEYTRKKSQTWAKAFTNKPRIIVMPYRRKGETICYGEDGKTLYLTTEGRPTPLWKVPLRPEE